jgi:hypothetical protein
VYEGNKVGREVVLAGRGRTVGDDGGYESERTLSTERNMWARSGVMALRRRGRRGGDGGGNEDVRKRQRGMTERRVVALAGR